MTELFLKIVNRSISASWLVLAVLLLRLLLKKAPKWANVLLWGIVAVRLICPVSIESAFSLIPSAETISPGIMLDHYPQVNTGVPELSDAINPIFTESFAPSPAASANPLQILIPMLSVLWVAGVALLLLYTALSYWCLRRKVSTAVLLEGNLFQSEYVTSPFVLGILRPRIYLPYTLSPEQLRHVVAHERAHIRRRDHWWKPLGFLLLTLHWFNPLVWVAYVLLCRDIELACDEKVIKTLSSGDRADYTQALVSCSISRRRIAACPLAFGEVGVKARVKSVLHYKKPTFWIILAAAILCAAAAVCFLTDPMTPNEAAGTTYHYGTVTEQGMRTVEGGEAQRGWLTLRTDDGEELEFWTNQDGTEFVQMRNRHVMLRSHIDKATGLPIATKVAITDHTWAFTKEEAIENAILDFNWSLRYEGMLQCADFVVLANEVGGPTATNQIDTEVYYGLALHQVFTAGNGALVQEGGSHIPTVLTFAIDDSGRYILTEYWEPRDGSYYTRDIKEKFPAFLWPDTQKYIESQSQRNEARAAAYFGLNAGDPLLPPLEDTVSGYSPEEAASDGCVVLLADGMVSGSAIWDDFIAQTQAGQPATVRLYQIFSEESSTYVVEELVFDGSGYTLRYHDEADPRQTRYACLTRSRYALNPRGEAREYFLLSDSPEATAEGYYQHLLSAVYNPDSLYNRCHMIFSCPID